MSYGIRRPSIFQRLDKDNDGVIDMNEANEDPSMSESKFRAMDANGDGKITDNENADNQLEMGAAGGPAASKHAWTGAASSVASTHGPAPGAKYKALYSCRGQNRDELNFERGAIITNVKRRDNEDEWYEGTLRDGTVGLFPATFAYAMAPGMATVSSA